MTGAVACGKSTFGKAFLGEYPYQGSITVDGKELGSLDRRQHAALSVIWDMTRNYLTILLKTIF